MRLARYVLPLLLGAVIGAGAVIGVQHFNVTDRVASADDGAQTLDGCMRELVREHPELYPPQLRRACNRIVTP